MKSASGEYDPQTLRQLASAVMDGVATESELGDLTELLRSCDDARDEYLAMVDMHAHMLEADFSRSSAVVPSNAKTALASFNRAVGRPPRIWRTVVVGLAVCLVATTGWLWIHTNDKPEVIVEQPSATQMADELFVTVLQQNDVDWPEDVNVLKDRIGADRLQILSGFLRLEFDSGVQVTLQGPADFHVLSPEKARLLSGVFTADVPPGAEGFTLETPTAEVVDLGTSFGVELSNNGEARVSVFDGEVTVAPRETSEKRLLKEGESVQVGVDRRMKSVDFDVSPFERLWPVASGVVRSSDVFRFVPPWPRQMRLIASDDDIFVDPEGRSIQLRDDLNVNISESGEYANRDELTPMTIKAGQRVRSLALHYMPTTSRGPRRAPRMTGSVTFDRPVLGLIVQHDELFESSLRFRRRPAGEGKQRRQLDLIGEPNGDRITLSEDRKTVSVDLISPGRSSDLVRVIVEDRIRKPRTRRRSRRRNE